MAGIGERIMDKKKLRQCAEGLIVTGAGLGYVLLSLGTRENPGKNRRFLGLADGS